eukprot:NODE_1762_length_745_cov_76.341424_g1212_i1.p1 GENE.NODE_1762_length_745_cov_76.341424_g1212_i1~~NODE_1762_length_745_cov_76.341424_g1212_i1.p1  ORF type:complete len:184 (-),score=30.30 NODE_1762_length_745_cov_76.341424_g1212_i1:194-676(-)
MDTTPPSKKAKSKTSKTPSPPPNKGLTKRKNKDKNNADLANKKYVSSPLAKDPLVAMDAVAPSYTKATASKKSPKSKMERPLPPGWHEAYTDSGRKYFIDTVSKRTTWLDPRSQEKTTLPYGWEESKTDDGRTFYINHKERVNTWLHPVEYERRRYFFVL